MGSEVVIGALVIDLDATRRGHAVDATNLVQRLRYEDLRSQVEEHVKYLEPHDSRDNLPKDKIPVPTGSGWVSFIDGTRGAGKSTFLTAALKGLSGEASLKGKLEVMPLIDPSRVEKSEIILLAILRLLKKRISDFVLNNGDYERDLVLEAWRKAFKKVAGGLSLFAPKHHPLDGLDPELFLEWGLERAAHSADLRENLQNLFWTACKILDVKALMFAFDDADTDATHAINLLECIRKYLDMPRVMVVVTGDMELYSLLVRQHFSKSVLTSDKLGDLGDDGHRGADRRAQGRRMLGHLEEQYLLKLFPLQGRLHLLPIWNLIKEKAQKQKYLLKSSSWNDQKKVEEVVASLVCRGFRLKNQKDIDVYTEFLLKQPLRSVLQILAKCAPILENDGNFQAQAPWSLIRTEPVTSGFRAMALTSLYRYAVDTDAIAALELQALSEAVFKLALRDGDLDTAAYLRPTSADQDIKNCFTALAAEVPAFLNGQPGALLRYMFYGPGSVSLYDTVRKRHLQNSDQNSETLENKFQQYMGIGRNESALNWARYGTAVLGTPHAINPTARVVRTGVIGLNQKTAAPFKAARYAINDAIKSAPNSPFPVFGLSLVEVSGTGNRTFASIFNILGLIEGMLYLSEINETAVKKILEKAYPTLSISSPVWESGGSLWAEYKGEEERDSEGKSWGGAMNALAAQIVSWLNDTHSQRELVTPSAVFIGKIWTRLYFSLEKAADDLRKSNVATQMEIFALCVINAFMVEEMDHHLFPKAADGSVALAYDRNNPRTSASTFVNKLAKLKPSLGNLPLTSIIATSPLLLGLLNPALRYLEAFGGLFPDGKEISGLLCASERWDMFDQLAVLGPKDKVGDDAAESEMSQATKRNVGRRQKALATSGENQRVKPEDDEL